MRWIIYALGGGMGHLTRAIALSRAANRVGHEVTILCNSEHAPRMLECAGQWLDRKHTCVEVIPATYDADECRERVLSTIRGEPCDALIVDTFPRGLGGELVEFLPTYAMPKLFIHRDLSRRYVAAKGLRSWIDGFDRILPVEQAAVFSSHPNAIPTSPWLTLDADELDSHSVARSKLRIEAADTRPVVVVVGCGRDSEVDQTSAVAAKIQNHVAGRAIVRWANLSAGDCPPELHKLEVWPLLSLLNGVDLLIGAGGYNTVNEARATNTPLLALARTRLYDRQATRLHPDELAANTCELVSRAVNRLLEMRVCSGKQASFDNGVHAAVTEIESVANCQRRAAIRQ